MLYYFIDIHNRVELVFVALKANGARESPFQCPSGPEVIWTAGFPNDDLGRHRL